MRTFQNALLLAFVFGLVLTSAYAQSQNENGKIHIRVSKEVNGETKVFEAEYDNEQQMHSDPNYKEFMGEDISQSFHFPGGHSFPFAGMKGPHGFHFPFADSMDFDFEMDTIMDFISDIELDEEDIKIIEERIGMMGEKMKKIELHINEELMNTHFSDSAIKEMEKLMSSFGNVRLSSSLHHHGVPHTSSKKLIIEQIKDEELGKKGTVKAGDQLNLEQFDYYPNPSDGNFRLSFKVPEQGALTVTVFDLEGKAVFVRSYDQFGGYFSEHIDLSGQAEGIYLLEVKLDKKRLTRKIVIQPN